MECTTFSGNAHYLLKRATKLLWVGHAMVSDMEYESGDPGSNYSVDKTFRC